MSRIQDQQFDQMMEEEHLAQCQRQLQEDEEYEVWLDQVNKMLRSGSDFIIQQNQLNQNLNQNQENQK